MNIARFLLMVSFLIAAVGSYGQGTSPTFQFKAGQSSLTLPGRDPAQGGTTVIPTVLVAVRLTFDARPSGGKSLTLDAAGDVRQVLRSPVFAEAAFKGEETTQYADALLRATVGVTSGTWHTMLGPPLVQRVTVEIPAGYGYMLTSKRTGTQLAMVDAEYVERAIFKEIPRQ